MQFPKISSFLKNVTIRIIAVTPADIIHILFTASKC